MQRVRVSVLSAGLPLIGRGRRDLNARIVEHSSDAR
jgi:hypothetical protein